jgi:flavin-dependent dehydrogenase
MTGAAHDVVIVGGGPAGACAASLLAQAGCRTLLIEKESAPRHKICGEFLSVEAQASLHALGIDPRALGGTEIDRVRLVSGRQTAEAGLPFQGVGLSRKLLDEALLECARASGAEIRRGVTVRELEGCGEKVRLSLAGGADIMGSTVFLATGKHDVRGAKRPPVTRGGDLIGFKSYFRLNAEQRRTLESAIEIVLFDGGYAGLQLVEDAAANLGLLVRRDRFEAVGKTWPTLLAALCATCPHLAARLEGAEELLDRPLSIFQVPYGFVHDPEAAQPAGLFRLGDQAAVIPSFSGDGIAIALHSARLAVGTYLARGDAATFHRGMRHDLAHQIRLASLLSRASQAPLARAALLGLCRVFPGLIGIVAARTRVAEDALRRTGLEVACR